MNYEIYEIDTNVQTLVCTISIGGWLGPMTARPTTIRFLQVKLPEITEHDAANMTTLAKSVNWSDTVNYGVYYFDANNQLQLRPECPGKDMVWDWELLDWKDVRSQSEKELALVMKVRTQRNKLLAESDWTDTASAPSRLGAEIYGAWQAYRQALRDVTSQESFPTAVDWPTVPAQ